MTDPNVNPQTAGDMSNDPGAPENTDEQYVSPDAAETLADEAAEAEAFETAADPDAEDPLTQVSDAEIADAVEEELTGDVAGEMNPDADGDGVVSDIEMQLAERTEDLQRVSAEYANYRRRTERERTLIAEQAKAKFAEQLLPLVDDLDLAAQHGDLDQGPLKAFSDKLHSTLEGQKIVAFGAEGDAFDPEIHEAVQDLSEGETKVIGTVLRKGYKIGDRLIRNAMVIIGDAAGEETSASE